MSIKWTKKQVKDLKKSVTNYNNKVKRLENKKGYNKMLVPEKLNFKELQSKITSKEMLSEQLKINKAFTTRSSERIVFKGKNGVEVPRFRELEIEIKLKRINKERRALKDYYSKFKATDRGIVLDGKFSEYDIGANNISEETFNPYSMRKIDFKYYLKGLEDYYITKESKDELYIENFYKGIKTVFDEEQANNLIKLLDELPKHVILDTYYLDEFLTLDSIYDPFSDLTPVYEEFIDGYTRVLERYRKGEYSA